MLQLDTGLTSVTGLGVLGWVLRTANASISRSWSFVGGFGFTYVCGGLLMTCIWG